jgi:hypothetical protein
VTGHRDSATVLDGDGKDFRLVGIGQRQFVTKGGNENRGRRAAFACGETLGGIDLGLSIDTRIFRKQGISWILNVVGEFPGCAVEPDIADHAVGAWVRSRRNVATRAGDAIPGVSHSGRSL